MAGFSLCLCLPAFLASFSHWVVLYCCWCYAFDIRDLATIRHSPLPITNDLRLAFYVLHTNYIVKYTVNAQKHKPIVCVARNLIAALAIFRRIAFIMIRHLVNVLYRVCESFFLSLSLRSLIHIYAIEYLNSFWLLEKLCALNEMWSQIALILNPVEFLRRSFEMIKV